MEKHILAEQEDFTTWWTRLYDLAVDRHMDSLLLDQKYHKTDWEEGLTIVQVLENRLNIHLERMSG
jgi:hypothetical protein